MEEKKYTHKNGNTYLVREADDGKREFFDETGRPLTGLELNVVRNAYEREQHPIQLKSDSKPKYKKGWNLIKEGEIIFAENHDEFYRKLLGIEPESYRKSSRKCGDLLIWTVYFDDNPRDGWRNHFLSDDECCQVNIIHRKNWNGADIRETLRCNRAVFEIRGYGRSTTYKFRGIFEYESEKSDPLDAVYFKKIADEFEVYTQG